jgi:hypothetical protein
VITHFQLKRHIGFPVGIAIFLALFPLLFSTPVEAGIISGDTNAISSTWTGTLHAAGVVTLGKQLVADIDYAVYAPGKFNLSFPGLDPSNNSQYVYAYQIYNNANPPSSDLGVSIFSVALEGNESPANIEEISTGKTSFPAFATAGSPPVSTSATWSYNSTNRITPSANSKILLFTSPYAPEWDFCTLTGFSGSYYQSPANPQQGAGMPSPVPEPCTFILLGMASFGLFACAWRKRYAK